MFEYQAEIITRNRYNFESSLFSADSYCWDNESIDPNDCIATQFSQAEVEAYELAIYKAEIADVQSDLIEYEIDMFFEYVSNTDLNYEDDHWFAGYCLATEFLPSENEYWREISIVSRKHAEQQLWSDLFIHSIDPQVGF